MNFEQFEMKHLLVFSILHLACTCCAQSDTPNLTWLEGKWERQGMASDQQAYEVWKMDDQDILTGKGVSLKNGDTTFVEKLRIARIDGVLYYIAEVSHNPEPTKFRITTIGDSSFECSNPDHDFPKAIRYELKEDQLIAEISGDGKTVSFVFTRVR